MYIFQINENSVQIWIFDTNINDKDLYNKLTRESTLKVGKNEFTLKFNEKYILAYMDSEMSEIFIKHPVLDRKCVFYERNELLSLLHHLKPINNIHGRILTDCLDDLDVI